MSRMKISHFITVVVFLFLVTFSAFSLFSGLTAILIWHEEPQIKLRKPKPLKGEIIAPLEGLNFDEGEWVAYIALSSHDYQLLRGRLPRNCVKLSDRATMKQMQQDWKMVFMGGDMATVDSHIIFLKDGEVAFSSGILLTDKGPSGLQSSSFGWIEAQEKETIWRHVSKFKPVYWPVIVL
jgi:hypothetical protein